MSTSYQSEIVDDSEPEREVLRRRQKFARKVHLRNTKASGTAPIAVIEITDDESDTAAHGMPLSRETADQDAEFRATTAQELLGLASAVARDGDIPAVGASPRGTAHTFASVTVGKHSTQPVSGVHTTRSDAAQDNTEAEGPGVNLARFAYPGANSSANGPRTRPGPSRQCSSFSSTTDSRPPPKKRVTHRFADDFSDSELGKLANHAPKKIGSCAPTTTSSKGKGKAGEPITTDPKTFLEEVVAESVSRKKVRRAETLETVKSVAQTRELILNKARVVIGSTSNRVREQEIPLHTQAVESHDLNTDDTTLPPSTQAFGRSALAQRHQKATSSLFNCESLEPSDAEESDAEISSTAMAFAPSKLGAICQPAQGLCEELAVLSYNGVTDNQEALPFKSICSPLLTRSPVDISDLDSREPSPHEASRTVSPTGRVHVSPPQSPPLSYDRDEIDFGMFRNDSNQFNEYDWVIDDACLHFIPADDNVILGEEGVTPPTFLTPSPRAKKTIAIKSPRPRSPSQSPLRIQVAQRTALSPKKQASSTKTPKTQRKKKIHVEDEPEEVWEQKMKEKILGDIELHLRILRYEPIHFDVFLQMALEGGSASGKLKLRLRSFLDKQAIHFYGAEPSTGRARRR
ncbi:hypothetical protein LshimejAT787_0108320 [Lyophyllum shimeji]|uniref:Uncharacterized protein n=1 Tax=Lyophyllum shimeji TaxID=47721 RepID=A0A9P3PEF8_LYOSH|nr:hypothetical protein LshimejAT787_0108320 [Lyophyllum shimeji]